MENFMLQVLNAQISITKKRLGILLINHEDLIVSCKICVYMNEKLWIRMPEFWTREGNKIQKSWWESKELLDEKQVIILNKVFAMIDLNLEKAIELRKNFFTTRKQLTKQENKLTLQRKKHRD